MPRRSTSSLPGIFRTKASPTWPPRFHSEPPSPGNVSFDEAFLDSGVESGAELGAIDGQFRIGDASFVLNKARLREYQYGYDSDGKYRLLSAVLLFGGDGPGVESSSPNLEDGRFAYFGLSVPVPQTKWANASSYAAILMYAFPYRGAGISFGYYTDISFTDVGYQLEDEQQDVPEPGTVGLIGLATLGLLAARSKRALRRRA